MTLGSDTLALHVWDTAGDERFVCNRFFTHCSLNAQLLLLFFFFVCFLAEIDDSDLLQKRCCCFGCL